MTTGPSGASQRTLAEHYLSDTTARFDALRTLAERAAAQVDDAAFHTPLHEEGNSIALLMKHMAGNLRSRFADFLTEDGEKPWRDRDGEFLLEAEDTREAIEARWREGWETLATALSGLGPDDLLRTVTIRGEPHTIVEALSRQLTHHAQHVGQIVMLAKHHAGPRWQTLSIPRGQSVAYTQRMLGG